MIEAHRLPGGVGLDLVEPRQLGLEIEQPRQSGLGEVVAVLAEREAGFLAQIVDPRAGQVLLMFRLGDAGGERFLLGADVVLGAGDLADRLAHHAGPAGALERIDGVLGARREHAAHAKKNGFRHGSTSR